MADVTGPISSLPGCRHGAPQGARCDRHHDRPAVVRVQGETDSYGSEMHDLCEECAARPPSPAMDGRCDWCKRDTTGLRPQRDYDEGLTGPVYYVCAQCRERYRSELKGGNDRE